MDSLGKKRSSADREGVLVLNSSNSLVLTWTKDFTVETSQLGTTDTGIWWRRCPCYHRLVVCLLPRLLIGSFSKTEPRFLEHLGLSCWRLSFLVLKAFAIFKVSFNSAIGLGASTASLSRLPTVKGDVTSCSNSCLWSRFARDRDFV